MSEVREDAEEKANRLGMLLVKPSSSEVFVDIDSVEEFEEFTIRWKLAEKLWPKAGYRFTESSSGIGHYHIYVTIPELDPIDNFERIAVQAALGSDPFRELLAVYHGRAGYVHTSVFFEKAAA